MRTAAMARAMAEDQLVDVRERLARIEVRQEEQGKRIEERLDDLADQMKEHNKVDKKNGNVVVPIAVVLALIEVVKQVIERAF